VTLAFVQSFADLTPNLGQFLGPKNNEGYKENEHHLRKAKIHTSIILPDLHCQQSERLLQTVVDCSVMSKPLPYCLHPNIQVVIRTVTSVSEDANGRSSTWSTEFCCAISGS